MTDFDQKYPEAAKVSAIPDEKRQAVGNFIEWFKQGGRALARYEHRAMQMSSRALERLRSDSYWEDTADGYSGRYHFSCSRYVLERILSGFKHQKELPAHIEEDEARGYGHIAVVPSEHVQEVKERLERAIEWETYPSEDVELFPLRETTEQLVAQFFGIDYQRYQEEREQMYKELVSGT